MTEHHAAALPAENPGSRWPKATLGALREGVRLTPSELATLQQLCAAFPLATAPLVSVTRLRLVLFACRSLERVVASTQLALAADADEASAGADSRARAAATLAEFDAARLGDYWFHVARDGGREGHYRGDARGATLVAPLPAAAVAACGVAAFRAAVDDALPGRWAWFADESLHVTVRALL
jgi:hypothetical protein